MAVLFTGCQNEDQEFGEIITPSNIILENTIFGQDATNPNGDGSGVVNFNAVADNAVTYIFNFGDGTANVANSTGAVEHRFTKTGVNRYNVTVVASGKGGVSSTSTILIDVFSAFDDIEARSFLTGAPITLNNLGEDVITVTAPVSKTWYLDKTKNGALGVGPSLAFDIQINGGPSQHYFPVFFAAPAGTVNDCFVDDELTFTINVDGSMTYVLDNKGQTFFNGNVAHQTVVGGSGNNGDECFDFDTSGNKVVSFAPGIEDWSFVPQGANFDPRGTQMNFSNDGFMGYYISSSSYEILEISETEMHVRSLDTKDPNIVWYHRFSTTK